MDPSLLGFAAAAGLVAALNPCGFAMLPGYLALVLVGQDRAVGFPGRPRGAVVGRALAATALMALGFLLVFGVFGLVVAPLAASLQQYLPFATVAVGVMMVLLGGWLLAGRELTVLVPKPTRGAPTARLGSMLGYGVAYALASLSCTVGPFLAVTSASFGTGSLLGGVAAYLAYGVGMAVVVGVLAVTVALAGAGAAAGFRRVLPYVNRVSGALLVIIGLYVGYYGVYELRLFLGNGGADDPVVGFVVGIQQTVSRWVDGLGLLPVAAVLAVLVAAGVLVGRRRRQATAAGARRTDR